MLGLPLTTQVQGSFSFVLKVVCELHLPRRTLSLHFDLLNLQLANFYSLDEKFL